MPSAGFRDICDDLFFSSGDWQYSDEVQKQHVEWQAGEKKVQGDIIPTSRGRYRLNKVVKQFFSCYLCCDRAAAKISRNVGRKIYFCCKS